MMTLYYYILLHNLHMSRHFPFAFTCTENNGLMGGGCQGEGLTS